MANTIEEWARAHWEWLLLLAAFPTAAGLACVSFWLAVIAVQLALLGILKMWEWSQSVRQWFRRLPKGVYPRRGDRDREEGGK